MKTLAISLLNWNSLDDTIICINSLLKSNFQDFDIFLLDNGSKNKEFEKLVSPEVPLLSFRQFAKL